MEEETMLTTSDNPLDPFEKFTSWFLFDIEKGYYTCAHLARLVNITDEMTQKEIDEETDRAIDTILETVFLGIYEKVTREVETTA